MTVPAAIERGRAGFFAGQPKAVYLIFSVEFWERFSYYGFLSILVLWLTGTPAAGGLGWSRSSALLVVGNLVGAVWIAPIVGGWVADRWIGPRRAIQLGGIGLAAGNALLAVAALLPIRVFTSAIQVATIGVPSRSATPVDTAVFGLLAAGLAAMVIGAGLFKSNASSLLSAQFAADDPRRNNAFTLFYMGINLGALAAPFGVGTLGEKVGWGYGFAAAAVGMAAGTLLFTALAPRWLTTAQRTDGATVVAAAGDRAGLWIILALVPFAIVFWAGFQQYSGAVNLFTADHVRRTVFGFVVPATWFMSLDPAFILLGGPFVAAAWARVDARAGRDMIVLKIVVALAAMAAGFAILFAAASFDRGADASPLAVVGFWVLNTFGELSLMPVGLALIGRVAPPRLVGTLMGVWLLTLGAGGVVAGWIGVWSERAGLPAAFGLTAVAGIAAAVVLAALGPVMQRRIEARAGRQG